MTAVLEPTEIFPRGYRYRPEMTVVNIAQISTRKRKEERIAGVQD